MLELDKKTEGQRKEYETSYGISIGRALPKSVPVRFVRVVLDSGEIEVLATSSLDEDLFPDEIFKELYFKRRGTETYYDVLKNRLGLENFSGKSVESVKQDVWSAVFISNFESMAIRASSEELEEKSRERECKNMKQVNKSVSFNAIKNSVISLFVSDIPIDETILKLYDVFQLNPTQRRE